MPDRKHNQFFFIGERPSHRAVKMCVKWEDGALAAATLFDALRCLGLDPHRQAYRNLYTSPVRGAATDAADERRATTAVKRAAGRGVTIVGMGRIVQRVLTHERIPHLQLRHPAARGAGRLRSNYRRHVSQALNGRMNLWTTGAAVCTAEKKQRSERSPVLILKRASS